MSVCILLQAAAAQARGVPSAGRSAANWAKIGAASVGAGALFAMTGQLAASPSRALAVPRCLSCCGLGDHAQQAGS